MRWALSPSHSQTLPVTTQRYADPKSTLWGRFAAASIIVSIPVMALFYRLQNFPKAGVPGPGRQAAGEDRRGLRTSFFQVAGDDGQRSATDRSRDDVPVTLVRQMNMISKSLRPQPLQ